MSPTAAKKTALPLSPPVSAPPGAATGRAGTVAFVGSGPGDPGLLTVRAADLLGRADVVVVDGYCGEQLLAGCRPDAEVRRAVAPDGQPLPPVARAGLAVEAARAGRFVVRVVEGDPGLFGGLAEEASTCTAAGIAFEVVPGVPVAAAVPTYAGIPLGTEDSREVRVVDAATVVDWPSAARRATVVVLNAAGRIPEVAASLLAAGTPAETPLALTCGGATPKQRTFVSTLGRAGTELAAVPAEPSSVIVIGEVVAHRDRLSWYETKPLFGWKVLVPRTKEQAGALSAQLRAYGAVPCEVPTIAVEPPRTPQQMERAVKGLVTGRYAWVAFTSTNAVRAIRERFEEYGLDARAFAGIKVAAVGEQTARALLEFGVKPDLVPSGEQSAAGLVEDWPVYDPVFDPIERVFLPRADIATETLVAGLQELGWEVDDVTAYRTVRAAPPAAEIREAIKGGGFDAVMFTSSSTVRNLVGIAGKPHTTTVIACIGPQTARTAEEHGLRVDVLAPEPSVAALTDALADFGTARRLAAIEAGEPVYRPSERRGRRRK